MSGLCHYCFACHLQTVHSIPVIVISISTKINSSFQQCSWFAKLRHGSIFSFRSIYALHITSRISCHVLHHVACALHRGWLLFPFLVFLLWVEPGDEFVFEEPVEYAYENQAYVNSENFAGKMTIPSKSLLSLLASCSLYCYVAIPITCYIMPPILPCQASNPRCPSKPLFGYVTTLLSPSYSVASCRWRLGFVPCWNMFIVGISLVYIVYF